MIPPTGEPRQDQSPRADPAAPRRSPRLTGLFPRHGGAGPSGVRARMWYNSNTRLPISPTSTEAPGEPQVASTTPASARPQPPAEPPSPDRPASRFEPAQAVASQTSPTVDPRHENVPSQYAAWLRHITGDIGTEESGRILYDEACERDAAPSASEVAVAAAWPKRSCTASSATAWKRGRW